MGPPSLERTSYLHWRVPPPHPCTAAYPIHFLLLAGLITSWTQVKCHCAARKLTFRCGGGPHSRSQRATENARRILLPRVKRPVGAADYVKQHRSMMVDITQQFSLAWSAAVRAVDTTVRGAVIGRAGRRCDLEGGRQLMGQRFAGLISEVLVSTFSRVCINWATLSTLLFVVS